MPYTIDDDALRAQLLGQGQRIAFAPVQTQQQARQGGFIDGNHLDPGQRPEVRNPDQSARRTFRHHGLRDMNLPNHTR